MHKVQLNKNLRRQIMRGHPWVYAKALKNPPLLDSATAVQLNDPKGEFLAWSLYDPHSTLAIRILSLDKKPPNELLWQRRLQRAWDLRLPILEQQTNSFRFSNGEGDLLPGLVCDIYNTTAVLQFDGKGPSEFWNRQFVAEWLMENTPAQVVIEKFRPGGDQSHLVVAGEDFTEEVEILENGRSFVVNVAKGQKTGFFLDQRDNRQYLSHFVRDLSVLNLFSYSGGFSIYAGHGQAESVTSVDVSQGAIDLANRNWQLNALDESLHRGICADVFEFLQGHSQTWECVIVDPPSMAHSEKQKPQAINKYVDLFSQAAKKVTAGGHLVLSSCSSHIGFGDFFDIINESLSKARRRGQVLRISGQGADHPYPHVCPELRYLKFAHIALS